MNTDSSSNRVSSSLIECPARTAAAAVVVDVVVVVAAAVVGGGNGLLFDVCAEVVAVVVPVMEDIEEIEPVLRFGFDFDCPFLFGLFFGLFLLGLPEPSFI